MEKEYILIKCIRSYKGEHTEIDCDGIETSSIFFEINKEYRAKINKDRNNNIIEYTIYPDREWDGTYRYDYIKLKEFEKYFKVIRNIAENEYIGEEE